MLDECGKQRMRLYINGTEVYAIIFTKEVKNILLQG